LMLAVVVALGGAWAWGYQTGKSAERQVQERRLAQALEDARTAQERLADELEAERQRRRIVYRDRIEVVTRTPDPSGCADIDLPDSMLQALRGDHHGLPTDRTLR
jgi:uncharacterized protein YdgA (DUF945 family)